MATTEDPRGICAACGHPATPQNPLTVIDGHPIHTQHTQDPRSGYYQAETT